MGKELNKYWFICLSLALALATLAVFWQVRNHDFIYYDDNKYVTQQPHVNAGLTQDGIIWAFTKHHAGNWHPLTSISHMLDCELFGLNPGGHHLTALLLHMANTLLLFAVFKAMTSTLWRSAFVAALFALHPLHIESVVWISERKDVLSTLFWILTMAAYLRYANRPTTARYLLVLLTFTLGLMAKPMVVTLPFVLLLLDYWPLGRLQNSQAHKLPPATSQRHTFYRLVYEKVPFFVLSAISSIVTFLVERSVGATTGTDMIPPTIRTANAFISYVKYIGKMVWPSRLAILYPHPGSNLSMSRAAAAALVLFLISICVIRLARSRKYLLVGWLWYLGTLLPVIGLIQVGNQALADRYTYVPLTGLFIIIAWGAPDLIAPWRYKKVALSALAVTLLGTLMIRTSLQLRHWRNSVSLFEHTLQVTSDNFIIQYNFGKLLNRHGRLDEAIEHYTEALRIEPYNVDILNNLGVVLSKVDKFDEAIGHFYQALQIEPDYAGAHYNLGRIFTLKGKLQQAATHYHRALQVKPDDIRILNNLGSVFFAQKKFDEAITHYRRALQLKPDYPEVYNNLGSVFFAQKKFDEAISHYRKALQLKPDYSQACNNLGRVLFAQGKLDDAIANFRQALQIDPNYVAARKNLDITLKLKSRHD